MFSYEWSTLYNTVQQITYKCTLYNHVHAAARCVFRQRSETTNKIEVRFRSSAENGLLLLVHKSPTIEGDYLAMALVDGAVQVSYNLGKQTPDNLHILRSNTLVDDNQWHTAKFYRLIFQTVFFLLVVVHI